MAKGGGGGGGEGLDIFKEDVEEVVEVVDEDEDDKEDMEDEDDVVAFNFPAARLLKYAIASLYGVATLEGIVTLPDKGPTGVGGFGQGVSEDATCGIKATLTGILLVLLLLEFFIGASQ